MKNKFLKLLIVISIMTLVMASCNNSPKSKENELENAQEDVVEAQDALQQSTQDSIIEYKTFMASIELKLEENQRLIDNQKVIISASKNANNAINEKELAKLEEKNEKLKEKIKDYEQGPAEKWELFKVEFNNEMDDLGQSISKMAQNNKKK